MARLKQGILGGISGSIGNVTGSSWKGIAVIKSKPLSVANPKTAAQLAQRGKMTNVVAVATTLLTTVVKPLWDRFAQKQSGFNAFIQANIDLFEAAQASPLSDMAISSGKMVKTDIAAVSLTDGGSTCTIDWADDSGEGLKLATDEVYAVVYDANSEKFSVNAATVTRDAGEVVVDLVEDGVAVTDLSAYLAFRRADGTVVSNTSYLLGS